MEERASGFILLLFAVDRQLGKDSLVGAWTTVATLLPVDDDESSLGA